MSALIPVSAGQFSIADITDDRFSRKLFRHGRWAPTPSFRDRLFGRTCATFQKDMKKTFADDLGFCCCVVDCDMNRSFIRSFVRL